MWKWSNVSFKIFVFADHQRPPPEPHGRNLSKLSRSYKFILASKPSKTLPGRIDQGARKLEGILCEIPSGLASHNRERSAAGKMMSANLER
jgi:hypothetical protein